MIYKVSWPPGVQYKTPSRFATWDEKIVDTTPNIQWALGMKFESAKIKFDRLNATVSIIPNTHRFKSVYDDG